MRHLDWRCDELKWPVSGWAKRLSDICADGWTILSTASSPDGLIVVAHRQKRWNVPDADYIGRFDE